MSEITSAICVQGLKFSRDGSEFYGGGGLNFELKFGEILAVLGQNGVGKTTLLNLCLGNLRPCDGKIEILGKNVAKMSTKELFNIVSYVPQAKNYGLSLSVIEMVLLGLNLCVAHTPKREHIKRAQRILDELEIGHLRDKICSRLSGGELQMVIFARSLVKDPRIVVLDEPESNLDFKNQVKIMEILRRLQDEGRAILLNTHYPQNAFRLGANALFLSRAGYDFGSKSLINAKNLSKYFEVSADFFGEIA